MRTEKHYGSEPLRAPKLAEGDIEIYSEPGRDIWKTDDPKETGVCYCSHYFKIVQEPYGGKYCLLVHHGGGEERIRLNYPSTDGVVMAMKSMDSVTRYLVMRNLLSLHHEATRAAEDRQAERYRRAFVEGRLKKRKLPRQNQVKVWIEGEANPYIRMG